MAKIKIDRKKIKSIFDFYPKESAVLVTSDDNTFLVTNTGKNMCRDHCKRSKAEFVILTREEFETGITEIESSKEASKKESTSSGDSAPVKSNIPARVLTQEDLDNDPTLIENGFKVGMTVMTLTDLDSTWSKGKWDEIIDFAKSKGLEATTAKNKGKDALIAEVQEFLNSREIGANDTTNHKTEK